LQLIGVVRLIINFYRRDKHNRIGARARARHSEITLSRSFREEDTDDDQLLPDV